MSGHFKEFEELFKKKDLLLSRLQTGGLSGVISTNGIEYLSLVFYVSNNN